jgi:hypothetical protein
VLDVIIILFALFAFSKAVLRFRDKAISTKEFLFWSVIWVVVILLVFLKSKLGFLTQLGLGGRPVDIIIYVSIILLFYLMFRIYVKIDAAEQNITKVVREIAIKKERKK